jgi:hypothetical protein
MKIYPCIGDPRGDCGACKKSADGKSATCRYSPPIPMSGMLFGVHPVIDIAIGGCVNGAAVDADGGDATP